MDILATYSWQLFIGAISVMLVFIGVLILVAGVDGDDGDDGSNSGV